MPKDRTPKGRMRKNGSRSVHRQPVR
jgi:hypothetical protein